MKRDEMEPPSPRNCTGHRGPKGRSPGLVTVNSGVWALTHHVIENLTPRPPLPACLGNCFLICKMKGLTCVLSKVPLSTRL